MCYLARCLQMTTVSQWMRELTRLAVARTRSRKTDVPDIVNSVELMLTSFRVRLLPPDPRYVLLCSSCSWSEANLLDAGAGDADNTITCVDNRGSTNVCVRVSVSRSPANTSEKVRRTRKEILGVNYYKKAQGGEPRRTCAIRIGRLLVAANMQVRPEQELLKLLSALS